MQRWNLAFRTPEDAQGWKRWLIYSPLARIIIFALLLLAFSLVVGLVLYPLGWLGKAASIDHKGWGQFISRALPALAAYLVMTRWVERRWPAEMSWRKLIPHGIAGIVMGIVLLGVVMGVLWLAGSYHVTGSDAGAVHWLSAILMLGLGAGISEEILFRGVLFRIVEEGLGTWAALLVSALAFGAVHLGNPNATWWSALAIAIEAGVLFGLVYHVTRSLWLCMGLHAAWNVMEGPVFGTQVSGLPAHGWLQSTLSGPDWLSGGHFGPEASLVTPVCCLILALAFLMVAIRRGSIVPPFWRRHQQV